MATHANRAERNQPDSSYRVEAGGKMPRRALLVDDAAATCEMIQKVLYAAGVEALTLTKSGQAPGFLEEGKFDLVLIDLHMSSPDGIELGQEMRKPKSNRTTPIILLSDDQRPSALAQSFAAGASFFRYKPIDKARLLKLVRATQQQAGTEKRQTRRVPLQTKVRLRIGSEEILCETINISLNGLLVKTPHSIPLGSPVQISVDLSPRMRPLVGAGLVTRIAGANQMGIALDQLPVEESERLQEFLLPMIPVE
ncbi:MAG TPA: response regulator [Methylomirabilota bacterium]|nr:response regulator [Methylomirabilota bacterium]